MLIYTPDGGSSWTYEIPPFCTFMGARHETRVLEAQGEWQALADNMVYREWTEPGEPHLGYASRVIESNPEPEDAIDVASRYLAGTQAERYQAQRESLSTEINDNRMAANQSPIDTQADPGLKGLMDESNAAAAARQQALDNTPDDQLDSFDPTLDPAEVGAVAAAASLYNQEFALHDAPETTPAQQADLVTAMAAHKTVVDAGDDAAAVPEVPASVRRQVGVPLEGFGFIIARRIEQGAWWYPEFDLYVDRTIDVSDYWIAVYDGSGTYMSTPFLTEVVPGEHYRADWQATNLARAKDFVFEHVLCYRHISNEQYERVVLPANSEYQRDRVRWSGITDPDLP